MHFALKDFESLLFPLFNIELVDCIGVVEVEFLLVDISVIYRGFTNAAPPSILIFSNTEVATIVISC